MKKIILAAVAVLLAVAGLVSAYKIGHNNGVFHALGDSWFTLESLGEYTDPTGATFDACMVIELDGQMYEQGLTIWER